MKLPEPIAWMERQMLNTGWSDWYHRNPRRKNDPLEITVDQIQFQFNPVYTESQLCQAIKDALEEALNAYSPDDTANDYLNKIIDLKESV